MCIIYNSFATTHKTIRIKYNLWVSSCLMCILMMFLLFQKEQNLCMLLCISTVYSLLKMLCIAFIILQDDHNKFVCGSYVFEARFNDIPNCIKLIYVIKSSYEMLSMKKSAFTFNVYSFFQILEGQTKITLWIHYCLLKLIV